ncbi:MAG TPA: helix-turn-helix transcriptional regulator [Planctomycetota bacterium]|nr:helix-turn-helix transcriptional regulator [Planctomycetota bacterium]
MRTLGLRLPAGHCIERHRHSWPQLVHATGGGLSIETSTGNWIVPHGHAVWIPGGFEHGARTTGQVRMRSLYVRPSEAGRLPARCRVLHVSPLLRELILEAVRIGLVDACVPEHAHLAVVLIDRIARAPEAPLRIDLPTDRRARRVADEARRDLASMRPLSELARGSGASARTLERLFVRETGRTFGRWMQHLRALHALERLAGGDSVTEAGLAVGYESTSAFISAFKRVLGATPGRFLVRPEEVGPDPSASQLKRRPRVGPVP